MSILNLDVVISLNVHGEWYTKHITIRYFNNLMTPLTTCKILTESSNQVEHYKVLLGIRVYPWYIIKEKSNEILKMFMVESLTYGIFVGFLIILPLQLWV